MAYLDDLYNYYSILEGQALKLQKSFKEKVGNVKSLDELNKLMNFANKVESNQSFSNLAPEMKMLVNQKKENLKEDNFELKGSLRPDPVFVNYLDLQFEDDRATAIVNKINMILNNAEKDGILDFNNDLSDLTWDLINIYKDNYKELGEIELAFNNSTSALAQSYFKEYYQDMIKALQNELINEKNEKAAKLNSKFKDIKPEEVTQDAEYAYKDIRERIRNAELEISYLNDRSQANPNKQLLDSYNDVEARLFKIYDDLEYVYNKIPMEDFDILVGRVETCKKDVADKINELLDMMARGIFKKEEIDEINNIKLM